MRVKGLGRVQVQIGVPARVRCCEGALKKWRNPSSLCGCTMRFTQRRRPRQSDAHLPPPPSMRSWLLRVSTRDASRRMSFHPRSLLLAALYLRLKARCAAEGFSPSGSMSSCGKTRCSKMVEYEVSCGRARVRVRVRNRDRVRVRVRVGVRVRVRIRVRGLGLGG